MPLRSGHGHVVDVDCEPVSETGPCTASPPMGRGGRGRRSRGRGYGRLAGGGFEEVAEDGLVGVEADAGVLEVDDDGVEVRRSSGCGRLSESLGP